MTTQDVDELALAELKIVHTSLVTLLYLPVLTSIQKMYILWEATALLEYWPAGLSLGNFNIIPAVPRGAPGQATAELTLSCTTRSTCSSSSSRVSVLLAAIPILLLPLWREWCWSTVTCGNNTALPPAVKPRALEHPSCSSRPRSGKYTQRKVNRRCRLLPGL